MEKHAPDIEALHLPTTSPKTIPHWTLLTSQSLVTPEVLKWQYAGAGTEEEPFVVQWIENDARNPLMWSKPYKWMIALTMAFATLAVSFCSSAYSGGLKGLMKEFDMSQEVATLGLSLFVLGFALGPLLWAPFSELYGRQILYFVTFGMFAFFNAGAAGAQNTRTILVLRFFAGAFGSSPLTNAGGVIADMFNARERGLAMSIFSAAPFMGPVIGPIIGGFLGETEGWRWIEGLMAIFSGALWLWGTFAAPETYAPVLLRKRAARLTHLTGKIHRSKSDIEQGPITASEAFRTSLRRPWILLFREPIVLLLSVYMAIIYGTLYLLFGAYPIVYQQERGWSEGIGGLPFVGVAIGMQVSILYTIFFDNRRYLLAEQAHGGYAPPEARLPPGIIGALALPVGLFWFAWTNGTTVAWPVSVAAGIPFGCGMVLVFLSIMNYLIDAYTIFAASVLAANSVIRSIFGAVFPLFTTQMYAQLGIHWASSIPAFLALACLPFPFLFYKYGASIRVKCKYAAEADRFIQQLRNEEADADAAASADTRQPSRSRSGSATPSSVSSAPNAHGQPNAPPALPVQPSKASVSADPASAPTPNPDPRTDSISSSADEKDRSPVFEEIKTATSSPSHHDHPHYQQSHPHQQSGRSARSPIRAPVVYEENPYDIDRVHTRGSFRGEQRQRHRSMSRSMSRSRSRSRASSMKRTASWK